MSANHITATILLEIPKRFPHIIVWRNNRIDAMAVGRGGAMRRVSAGIDGQADLTGIIGPSGRRIEIEVKAGRDSMRLSQKAFREMIVRHGGIYLIARDDVEDFFAELREVAGI